MIKKILIIVTLVTLMLISIPAQGFIYNIQNIGSRIVYSNKNGLFVVDTLLNPIAQKTTSNCFDFEIILDKAYCISNKSILIINIITMETIQTINLNEILYSIDIYNNKIYTIGNNLYVLDINNLEMLETKSLLGTGNKLEIANNIIYLTSSYGLEIYDINLQLIGKFKSWHAIDLRIIYPNVYIADDTTGIKRININTNLITPIYDIGCKKVYTYNGYVYASNENGIYILEKKYNENYLSYINIAFAGDFLIRGSWLYASTGYSVLYKQIDIDLDGFTEEDCNIYNGTIYPGAYEICDGLDNNCDRYIPSDEIDNDGDGYMVCEGDCNDYNHKIYPGNGCYN